MPISAGTIYSPCRSCGDGHLLPFFPLFLMAIHNRQDQMTVWHRRRVYQPTQTDTSWATGTNRNAMLQEKKGYTDAGRD